MAGKKSAGAVVPPTLASGVGGIRNRIREVRQVRLGDLTPHDKNWRKHSDRQRGALKGLLDELGWCGAVLAYEPHGPGKGLTILDGHLRAEEAPDLVVPVLVLDLTEKEAALALSSYDPLSALAEVNAEALDSLLRDISVTSPAVQGMLADLHKTYLDRLGEASDDPEPLQGGGANRVPESQYGVIVICENEQAQKDVYETLVADGYTCRVVCV